MLESLEAGLAAGLLVAVVLLAAAALLVAVRLSRERRLHGDVRQILAGIEGWRANRASAAHRLELDPASPLAPVADALNRALSDLAARHADAAATEERLRLVMEAFRDAAFVTVDVDGDIRTFSPGASGLLGYTEEEARSKALALLFEPASYNELLAQLGTRAERERGIVARTAMRRKDGSTFPAELAVRTLHGGRQDANGLLIVVQDRSRHASLEDELRRSEERHRRLLDGLVGGVATVRAGRLLYANPAFCSLCGLPAERLIGTTLRDRIATRDVLLVEEALERLERDPGRAEELRCTFVAADGRTRSDVRLHAAPVLHEGEPAVLLLVHDETAGRRIEGELRRNESQLDAVLEAVSESIVVLAERPGGTIVQMTNRAFLHTFGLTEADVLGRPAERLIAGLHERGGGAAAVAALLAAADVQGGATATITLEGFDARELEVSIAALHDREGRRFGRMLVSRDLTAERAAQRELQERADQLELRRVMLERAQEELERKRAEERAHAEELDRVNRELRRLDEMRQQLLGNVSHELQAPLVAIRGFTEMILRERLGPITEEQRRGLSLSLSNTDRLIGLIETIASGPGDDELRLTRFALRTLIEETVTLLRGRMEEKGLSFSLDAPEDGLVVQADRDKIQQVLINVLQNAIKFNRQGGSIEVAVRRSGERFLDVDVIDTGQGIPPEALERIFERHYRSESGAGEEGRGLGLAIVREILDRHGCRIRARSELGKWTRISFSLPQSSGTELDPTPEDDESSEGPADGSGRPRFRVIRRYRRR